MVISLLETEYAHIPDQFSPPEEKPFWLFTEQSSDTPFESFTRGQLLIKRGSIGHFSTQEIGSLIDLTVNSYLHQGLFNGVPLDDRAEVQAITASMRNRFNADRLVIMIKDLSGRNVVGGCMVAPGELRKPISKLIASPDTNLPTLFALHFTFPSELAYWADINEVDTACFTRFARVTDDQLIADFGLANDTERIHLCRQFSMETINGMAIASAQFAQYRGTPFTLGILDTHDPKIVTNLCKYNGGRIIDGAPQKSPLIGDHHPLRWHYNMPGIQVIGFDARTQLKLAQAADLQLGDKIPA